MTSPVVKVNRKSNFICYLCEKQTPMKDRGAILSSSGIIPDLICSNCVHKNYCWATDKDLSVHNYTELEAQRRASIGSL